MVERDRTWRLWERWSKEASSLKERETRVLLSELRKLRTIFLCAVFLELSKTLQEVLLSEGNRSTVEPIMRVVCTEKTGGSIGPFAPPPNLLTRSSLRGEQQGREAIPSST